MTRIKKFFWLDFVTCADLYRGSFHASEFGVRMIKFRSPRLVYLAEQKWWVHFQIHFLGTRHLIPVSIKEIELSWAMVAL
jgi:hypothetical protein